MNRQIYSCPDYHYKLDLDGKPINSPIIESDCIWNSKLINVPTSKRKPIILKRGRSSWPVTSNGKDKKNLRDTCRGSAGTAESLENDRQFHNDPQLIARRNSFLYRSDSLNSRYFTCGNSSKSLCFVDQQIRSQDVVTPFAQILLTLRLVKNRLSQIFHSNKKSVDTASASKSNDEMNFTEVEDAPSVSETLSNLEWCLFQLENVQTHRSVSELATSKFKRLLSRELIHKSSKSINKNICDFICQTFMDETPNITEDLDDALYNQNNWHSTDNFNLDSPEDKSDHNQLKSIPELIINEWGPNIFELELKNENCILRNVTMSIFEIRKLFTTLKMDLKIMENFLTVVESNYMKCNSYHNSLHAADVVQSVHFIISMAAFKNVFSDIEIFAALLSAVIHDVDHPGVTNQFLISTNDSLAILYNDISVLENHHLAVGFSLMKKDGCNVLASFSRVQQQAIRRIMIDMVLATDMSKHMTMLADLKTMVETKKVSGSGILNLDNYNDRIQILQNLIHCADLSNPTKPLNLYIQWTERVMEEFFSQGDKEKELGIESSPMCDRLTASVAKSQVSFIDFIVYPLWEAWGELVQPEANVMLKNICQNRQYYEKLSEENDLTEST